MFTKEKLEAWIPELNIHIAGYEQYLNESKEKNNPVLNFLNTIIEKRRDILVDLKHTLEQLYTTMTSDNSI